MEILDKKFSKYKVFFAEKGITSTSANHVSNKGKELLKSEQAVLDNINFVNTTASLLSGGESRTITKGMNADSFESMHKTIAKIANLNAMSAWIHEAIKAKTEILEYVQSLSIDKWAKDQNIELPNAPIKEFPIVESDVIGTWDVAKRNKYYVYESYCSLVGKFIHPKGAFYEAKAQMNNAVQNPNKVEGSGRDAIIYSYEPSMPISDVNVEYNWLSTELRHKEAEFNKMKQEIVDAITEDKLVKAQKFNDAYAKYIDTMESIRNKFDMWKTKAVKEVSALKIYLPQGPKQTYDEINK
jgi:hypothetical protein|nr:MAG TPA: hypothetical protein [Bacteriophage sp.]